MSAKEYNISGVYLRGVLAGLRKITGQQYTVLLEKVGLGHFSQKYPPATFETVATGAQLIEMLQAVRDLTGPVVFKFFYSNLGRGFGQAMATLPQLQPKKEAYAKSQISLLELITFIDDFHYQTTGGRIETISEAGSSKLTLVFRDCIYCAGHHHSEVPVCVNVPAMYKQLLLEVTGKRYQVTEIRCGAMEGGTDCYFQIQRGV